MSDIKDNSNLIVDETKAPAEVALEPSAYQKQLIKQWYESGHKGPAPFASDGTQLFWMNRAQRRAKSKQAKQK